jgi:hypothetical protein
MRLFFALAMLSASLAAAEEKPVEIPLKSVWASPMPGTKMAAELDPAVMEELKKHSADEKSKGVSEILVHTLKDKSIAFQLLAKLKALPEDEPALKGFAVEGTGLDALRNALAHIEKPLETLPEGEVSLVFFAYRAGQPVHLQKVTRGDDNVDVYYRLAPSATPVQTEHYALIPLGALRAGKYHVGIHISPERQENRTSRKVCKPFSFTVEER